jgi:uncharacterized protein (DUF1800 family)
VPSRREILKAGGLGALGLSITGCDRLIARAAGAVDEPFPASLQVPTTSAVDPARHLLDRAAFGPAPGDLARVKTMGTAAWIDEQLDHETIDDTPCEIRTAFIDTLNAPSDLAFEIRPEVVERDLVADALLRAVYSKRQLYEVMVGFWSDHFHVAIGKAECRHLTAIHVRDAIRRNALGDFRSLLRGAALSPAMLVYLDGRDNAVSSPRDVPNENHARELLELHTLGVHGGYTQQDVMEAARCLTGWVVRASGAPGSVRFDPSRHDDGEKRVLGERIEAGLGEGDLDRLLSIVLAHPSCARYVSRRLCRRLVSEDPPASVVERAARRFEETSGDIRETVRVILRHDAFAAAAGAKLKRPFRFVASALRALGAETHARSDLRRHLEAMGHAPHHHPTPDGYPEDGDAWLGTMLPRFRFALALVDGELDDTRVDLERLRSSLGDSAQPADVFAYLVGRVPTSRERRAISSYLEDPSAHEARLFSLGLSSPGYQRC